MLNLEELRRLEEEATPGPWSVDRHFVIGPQLDTDDQSHGMINGVADIYGPNRSKDAALIVAMRNALPELLSQHEQLIERVLRYATDYVPRKALEEAQAENASLRRVNKALGNMLEPHGGGDV